jgi:cation diffusion facilitator family transporter
LLITALIQLGVVALSGSVALMADTIHNFSDALTAVPLLIAFRLAQRPPTRRYTYGYHRAEDVAGVVIVGLILVSVVFAAIEAVRRLFEPQTLEHAPIVLVAGLLGFIGNEAVAVYRIRVGRDIGSAALLADGYHARADGFTSLGVVAAAVGALAGFPQADAIAGLVITAAVAATLVQAGRSVLHRVLDGTDEATIALIESVAAGVPGVEHVTDAHARWTGHRLRAELDIDVEPSLSVGEGHEIADLVRRALLLEVARLTDATVHVDPHDHATHADESSARAEARGPVTSHGQPVEEARGRTPENNRNDVPPILPQADE